MLYLIEGPRNVGKTFLLNKLDKNIYKFPFVKFIENINVSNNNENVHFFAIGGDLAVLELHDKGFINTDIYCDRSFISSLVFGVLSNRISYNDALKQGRLILNTYKKFKVIYIYSEFIKDDRNKDIYSFYSPEETHNLYIKLFNDLNIDYINFYNEKNDKSVVNFKKLF